MEAWDGSGPNNNDRDDDEPILDVSDHDEASVCSSRSISIDLKDWAFRTLPKKSYIENIGVREVFLAARQLDENQWEIDEVFVRDNEPGEKDSYAWLNHISDSTEDKVFIVMSAFEIPDMRNSKLWRDRINSFGTEHFTFYAESTGRFAMDVDGYLHNIESGYPPHAFFDEDVKDRIAERVQNSNFSERDFFGQQSSEIDLGITAGTGQGIFLTRLFNTDQSNNYQVVKKLREEIATGKGYVQMMRDIVNGGGSHLITPKIMGEAITRAWYRDKRAFQVIRLRDIANKLDPKVLPVFTPQLTASVVHRLSYHNYGEAIGHYWMVEISNENSEMFENKHIEKARDAFFKNKDIKSLTKLRASIKNFKELAGVFDGKNGDWNRKIQKMITKHGSPEDLQLYYDALMPSGPPIRTLRR